MLSITRVLLLLLACQFVTSTPIFDRGDGTGFHGRSTGFGETIRDWIKELKNKIVGKWQEWFGQDGPTRNLSPQDIFNIDKSIEGRVSGLPNLFIDMWNDYDDDSDEWSIGPFNLPLPPIFKTPDFRKFGIPATTQSSMTTPEIGSTTSRQQTTQIITQTQSALTPTESTVTVTEATITSTESIPFTTQLITTSAEPSIATSTSAEPSIVTSTSAEPSIVTSTEEILTSSESIMTNSEPVTAPSESTSTSMESFTETVESSVPTDESILFPDNEPPLTSVESNESIESTISTTEPALTSVESNESIESTISTTVITETIMTATEESTVITTTTESPITPNEQILPTVNKRVEDNETINSIDRRTTTKPRPASAEVIMF